MSIANYFYNKTTKKYIALFGSIFNKLQVVRDDNSGAEIQRMIVPISYGPYQKFLARIEQDPELNRKSAITLPRMAFEIMSMTYDGSRKLPSINKIRNNSTSNTASVPYQYAPAPYNIEFNLYIMAKYAEDGTQIIEQTVPFFKPEWTTTVKLIDDMDPFDVPLILNNVTMEDLYEADFETRRSLLWTLSFTMKAWYFGPSRDRKVIKFIDARFFTDVNSNILPEEQVIVTVGLTANGEPTSTANNSIPYEQIDIDDDWGVITIIQDFEE